MGNKLSWLEYTVYQRSVSVGESKKMVWCQVIKERVYHAKTSQAHLIGTRECN